MTDKPPTSDQIRRAIDSGKSADKIAFPDPAAAPLGTDDEASGHPPTAEQRDRAASETTRARPKSDKAQWAFLPLVIGVPLLVVIVALYLALSGR